MRTHQSATVLGRRLISCSTISRYSISARNTRRGLRQDHGITNQQQATVKHVPEFAFTFDIDGVLLRSSKPLPGAREALLELQKRKVPFIFLTNGGGKPEAERVKQLQEILQIPLNESIFVQSHTPYAGLVKDLKDEPILVGGGEGDKCRRVAESYGFNNVISPSDIFHAHPEIWPFSAPFADYHAKVARPLPLPIFVPSSTEPTPADGKHLRIHSMFIYNDPRDMGLEMQIILDLLLSFRGFLGTRSKLNGRKDIENHGYQQDGQPPLYIANPDLFWAAQFHISRLGTGGFEAQLRGLWHKVTGLSPSSLYTINGGKPHTTAYDFAERKLWKHWRQMHGQADGHALRRAYMVGDNPASDIAGANSWQSPKGTKWSSYLVRSGVWQGEKPEDSIHVPTKIVDGVYDAVQQVLELEEKKATSG